MARVLVVSDDEATTVEIRLDDLNGAYGMCSRDECRDIITDRGHFEDTVQAAELHVDQRH
jgi:hypothetical protein